MHAFKFVKMIFLLLVGLSLAGCSLQTQPSTLTAAVPTDTVPPTAVDTPMPSLTPTEQIAYAAMVNGEGIRQSSFDASLFQLEQAIADFPQLFEDTSQAPEEQVLDSLINRALLSQAARENGFIADQQLVSERFSRLTEQAGGEQAMTTWLDQNGYTLETFLLDLPVEIEAAWQRDQIAAGVPDRMEQVRARQLLFYDPFQASRAFDQLQAGIPFESVLENNDPNDLGYLDWFPRGILLLPELEEIAFSLSPGQHSEVIATDIGYHILYVIERDPDHLLSPEIRLILQEQAVQSWLAARRSQAAVEILMP